MHYKKPVSDIIDFHLLSDTGFYLICLFRLKTIYLFRIKIVIRHTAAHWWRVWLIKYCKILIYACFHFIWLDKCDITIWNCFLGNCRFKYTKFLNIFCCCINIWIYKINWIFIFCPWLFPSLLLYFNIETNAV